MANLGMGTGKIMIHKATEFSREASNMQRAAEQAQAAAQKATNAQADALSRNVQDVNKAEPTAISRDDERGKNEGEPRHGQNKNEANREADEKIIAQADVGKREERLLDIRI